MFINSPGSVDAVRPQHKVDCFDDRRLAGIVVTDQDSVLRKPQLRFRNSAEIFDRKVRNSHDVYPASIRAKVKSRRWVCLEVNRERVRLCRTWLYSLGSPSPRSSRKREAG